MQLSYQYADEQILLDVEPEAEGYRVRLPDGSTIRIAVQRLPDGVLQIEETETGSSAGRAFRVAFLRNEREISLSYGGQSYRFAPGNTRPAAARRSATSGALTAPMVGVITAILVTEGQSVEAYQPLVAVEAMKVVAILDAPFAGTVQKLYVQQGERVEHGAPIVDIAPAAAGQTN